MDKRPESPTSSLQRYFNSIINVSPTRTDFQGLIGVPYQSPAVTPEASHVSLQTSTAQADKPEPCSLTVDRLVATEPDHSIVMHTAQKKVSERIGNAVPRNTRTRNSSASVDKSDHFNKHCDGGSARKKLKGPNGAASFDDRTKCSNDCEENQETGTFRLPENRSQSPMTAQENEHRGDCTPRYNLRRNRSSINLSQAARTSNPKNKPTSVRRCGKENIQTTADSNQKGEERTKRSKSEHESKRPASVSSSSSSCSEGGAGPLPLISRDLWNTTSRKPSKPHRHVENQAYPKPDDSTSESPFEQFMKDVYPELVKKKSLWAKSGVWKSPLAVAGGGRLNGLVSYHEKAPVEKRSLWSVPKALSSGDSESDKGSAGPSGRRAIKGASAFKCKVGLQQKGADIAKRLENSQHEAGTRDVEPVYRETRRSLVAEGEPRETQNRETRISKAPIVSDHNAENIKPRRSFWDDSWKLSSKTTYRDRSPLAVLKVTKEVTPPEAPATRIEPLNTTDDEGEVSWIQSLWKQRQAALAKAAAMRSVKAPRTHRTYKISKPPVLEKQNKEPTEPPKGVLQHEAKDAIMQTSGHHHEANTAVAQKDPQHEAKDAVVQTSFICMVGKSIKLDRTAKKHLRGAFHANEGDVAFLDMSLQEACGDAPIMFGHYISTCKATVGIMRLGPNTEKPMAANNENDMFLYALDTGVNITTVGGTWLLLSKGSTFYVPRGLPFTLKNLGLTISKILYILTEPGEAGSVT